eukprot:GSMAST32.ASY1.ANO1.577.1 assembled CDS
MWYVFRVHLIIFALVYTCIANALDNGLARTPPQGWSTWNTFGCDISEKLLLEVADAIKKRGMLDMGYDLLNIDDCWASKTRDAVTGRMVADPVRFPSGMGGLVKNLHAKGFRVGLYTDVGSKTCAGYPGSENNFILDAKTFADWEIDYLKIDRCYETSQEKNEPWEFYTNFSAALNATGRPIEVSICNWGFKKPWTCTNIGNLWRTTTDIFPSYQRVITVLDEQVQLAPFAGPGHWNDPDMYISFIQVQISISNFFFVLNSVGVKGNVMNYKYMPSTELTISESSLHFSIYVFIMDLNFFFLARNFIPNKMSIFKNIFPKYMWGMLAAPLIAGADIRTVSDDFLKILTNAEIIHTINQDPLGIQATREFMGHASFCYGTCKRIEVWVKPLVNGRAAVALLNVGDQFTDKSKDFKAENVSISVSDIIGLSPSDAPFCVHDALRHIDTDERLTMNSVLLRKQIPVHSHELLLVESCTIQEEVIR